MAILRNQTIIVARRVVFNSLGELLLHLPGLGDRDSATKLWAQVNQALKSPLVWDEHVSWVDGGAHLLPWPVHLTHVEEF